MSVYTTCYYCGHQHESEETLDPDVYCCSGAFCSCQGAPIYPPACANHNQCFTRRMVAGMKAARDKDKKEEHT